MQWVAPSEKDTDNAALEKRLWDAADQFWASSGLMAQEYSALNEKGRAGFIMANSASDTSIAHL